MNNVLSRTTIEPQKYRPMVNYFVGQFVPFVCYLNSVFIPFICKNIPNSTFLPVTQRIRGFTLIELVVTMAVAAILVAIAVPNMRTFIQNGRLNTQANDLIGDLSLARSEAIKRRSNVGITTSTTGTCATGGDWRNGRVIFVDINNNGICDAPDLILRFREPLASANDTLATNPLVLPDPIIFGANGASNNIGGVAGFFTFCDSRGASNRKQVNLNPMGQATVSTNVPGGC
jgi:type IV fimbrial biogenesis protein FimT